MRCDTSARRHGGHAFSLIELLVVISIIALLVGILVPTLASARESARTVFCLNNMRQLALATTNYANAYEGHLPTVGFSHGSSTYSTQAWFFLLEPYSDGKLHYRCPSDKSVYWDTPAPSSGLLRRLSYATNYLVSGQAAAYPSSEGWNRLDRSPRPTRTVYAVELTPRDDTGGFATADHVHPETWLVGGIDKMAEQVEIDRHQGGVSNYAYLDGHAETEKAEDTYLLDPASTFPNLIWTNNHFWPDVAR
ncbi:MAG: DUF1559 domain-containing protein [Planctomycetota bacterium]